MTCSRSAGIEEISRPPLRAMTAACCSGDKPGASLTSSDDPVLCAFAESEVNASSSAQKTAKIRGEFTRALLIRGIALALLLEADNVGRPLLSSDRYLEIISGNDGHTHAPCRSCR